ncbi:DNA-binding response regulator [Paenibacillus agaridevorans]|uniref:DNA-binding response regulator n=1 Tax=Paenibacillus agaridevorans TaxID=171404 RepID=A0A2R5ESN1_9BACL|nr:response regulator [Paenibacillus agaridevorans]GBG09706.1 DNA-binding response regulator [Paenibacillus agaridevorans]
MFRVIIADDEYDIRQGLKQVIDWYGEGFVIVGEAEDGDEAMELYKKERPNLLITDIKMPGMNGLQLSRAVKELDEGANIIILSGYDDFVYAKEAIQYGVSSYLLKPVDEDELRTVLASVRRSLEEEWSNDYLTRKREKWVHDYFFQKLIRGESIQKEVAETMRWQAVLERHYFRVLLIELSGYGDMLLELRESDIHLIRFAVRNILEEIVRTSGNGFVFEECEQRFGILLVGEDRELSIDSIDPVLQQIVDFTKDYAKQKVMVGVGVAVGHASSIVRSYEQAKSALGKAFFDSQAKIFTVEEAAGGVPAWSLDWHADMLKKEVFGANRAGWKRELRALFHELEKRSAPLSTVRNAIVYAIMQLSRLVIEQEGDWKQLYADRYGETDWIAEMKSQEKAEEELTQLCESISEFLRKTRETPPDSEIGGVVAYIRSHYWEDINLKKIAGMFYITSGYLGQLFKKETGKYFNDFINEIRVEAAKQLLRDPRWSIADIAEKVGYKNTNHLYLHFKNYAGISPGDYRKQL